MELPVADWQDYAHRKWLQISSHEKGQFSPESDLKESFDACWSLLQQEEEEILERLCSDLSVGKEPRAVLFFKEEGNKRFGRKQYTAAAVLYSKAISHGAPGTEEIAVCFANRSAVLFHLGHYSFHMNGNIWAEDGRWLRLPINFINSGTIPYNITDAAHKTEKMRGIQVAITSQEIQHIVLQQGLH
ncbi:protein-lysine N-methyltransferase SMYD4 [Anomaloglossus baeobatrachus]|uniref:protein-lysine N-methyltransferase SMYD4 n=1 Tax=Anomaloglossus baeobatrachus TaxID=238106 RepID=UPI003F4F9CC3